MKHAIENLSGINIITLCERIFERLQQEETQPANSQNILCPLEKSSDNVIMDIASFMFSSIVQVAYALQLEFHLFVRRSNSDSWEIDSSLYVLYSVRVLWVVNRSKVSDPLPEATDTPLSPLNSVPLHIFVNHSAAVSAFNHVAGFVSMCVCASWITHPHVHAVSMLNRFAANARENFSSPAQICTLPGVNVCSLKHRSSCFACQQLWMIVIALKLHTYTHSILNK